MFIHNFPPLIPSRFFPTNEVAIKVRQVAIGLAIGALAHHSLVYPLMDKIFKELGVVTRPQTLNDYPLGLAHLVFAQLANCIVAPCSEEYIFRGYSQSAIKDISKPFYLKRGFSDASSEKAARVTSVLFIMLGFGCIHFLEGALRGKNSIDCVPLVVGTSILGLLCGIAKEFTGTLHMPIGIHTGFNIVGSLRFETFGV